MRRHPVSTLFVLSLILLLPVIALAQDGPRSTTLSAIKKGEGPVAPTTADVMRERVAQAKAYLVVKNYPAAIYELENIRRDTEDATVNRVLNVLLMHAYLEQGDYKKAQAFLKELHKNPVKALDYFAVAGQVISGARSQLARYDALGVSVKDSTLPEEAKSDLESMRETLELIIVQSKETGKREDMAGTAVAVLEESSAARGKLAKDVYDEKRWKDQVSDAREQIVNPRSNIIDAVEAPVAVQEETPNVTLVAKTIEDEKLSVVSPVVVEKEDSALPASTKKDDTAKINDSTTAELKAVVDKKSVIEDEEPAKTEKQDMSSMAERSAEKPAEEPVEKPGTLPLGEDSGIIQPTDRKVRIIGSAERKPVDSPTQTPSEESPNVKSTDETADNQAADNADAEQSGPLSMGSLIAYATKRVNPVYPRQARSMRMQGTVTVEVIVDEDGTVSKIETTSGPAMLKRAAMDALRKWKFTPFTIDGQPVKATGFVSFNFNL